MVVLILNLIVTSLIAALLIVSMKANRADASEHSKICATLPIAFIHAEPNCTNRLLQALNLTSVRIGAPERDIGLGNR